MSCSDWNGEEAARNHGQGGRACDGERHNDDETGGWQAQHNEKRAVQKGVLILTSTHEKFACFAVDNAAYHNDMQYEELRRSIPELTTLLLGPEEDKTKGNAAGTLSNLVRNSDMLLQRLSRKALLKMIGSYSTVAQSPRRRDALTESLLRIVLFALRKMCDHAICRNFLSIFGAAPSNHSPPAVT